MREKFANWESRPLPESQLTPLQKEALLFDSGQRQNEIHDGKAQLTSEQSFQPDDANGAVRWEREDCNEKR